MGAPQVDSYCARPRPRAIAKPKGAPHECQMTEGHMNYGQTFTESSPFLVDRVPSNTISWPLIHVWDAEPEPHDFHGLVTGAKIFCTGV